MASATAPFEKYWKAIAGAITPGVVVIVGAVSSGSDGGTSITQAEWITAIAAVILTGGAVYAAPPRPSATPPPEPEPPSDPAI